MDRPETRVDELDLAPFLGEPVRTIPEMLRARARLSPAAPALWRRDAAGVWQPSSWAEFDRGAAAVAARLSALGLRPGDRVGIAAASSPAWDIAQIGVLAAGGVIVGLDAHDLGERATEIATRCGLAGLVVQDRAMVDRLGGASRYRFVVGTERDPDVDVETVADIVAAADSPVAAAERSPAGPAPSPVEPDAPATIIFTSGTTGAAKGIQYTHRQVLLAVAAMLRAFADIEEGSRLACWLPLSNLFQRMLNACAIARGAQVFYVERPQEIMEHLPAIAPHLFIGVPRFYEKLYAGIVERIDAAPAMQRRLGHWALDVGSRYHGAVRAGQVPGAASRLLHALADRLVLGRIRAVMGANLRYLVSGSAPMPAWLLDRFRAMGWLVLEAYGLSENIVPVAANRPDAHRLGTVGRAMPGSEVRLAGDGELHVRGPGVCTAYYADAKSRPALDADGFLATGDYAAIDGDGYITLTGRKSELFKTSTGRRIAPAGIEACLRVIPYVEHAVVVGAGRPFPIAIVAFSEARLRAVAGVPADAPLAQLSVRMLADVAASVAQLPDYQRPAGIAATARAFTIEGGELTPNLKLRRPVILESFAAVIDELYGLLEHGDVAGRAHGQVGRVLFCDR